MSIIPNMIIGLVLCGLVAVLLFFGVAEQVFKSFGITYWLAFVLIGVLIGSAFIPSFSIGAVTFNVAGFIAPLVFAVIFMTLCARTREVWRALITMTTVAAMFIAIWLLIEPITNGTVTVIIVGFLCGAIGFLVGKTKLAALAAVFTGLPIGEVVSSTVGAVVSGSPMSFGSAAMFDAVVLSAVFSVVLFEAVAAIKRTMNKRAVIRSELAEIAEEFNPDEYKKYFDE